MKSSRASFCSNLQTVIFHELASGIARNAKRLRRSAIIRVGKVQTNLAMQYHRFMEGERKWKAVK
jgi:tRNA A37 threonylcarbamoyltransferase TsaD